MDMRLDAVRFASIKKEEVQVGKPIKKESTGRILKPYEVPSEKTLVDSRPGQGIEIHRIKGELFNADGSFRHINGQTHMVFKDGVDEDLTLLADESTLKPKKIKKILQQALDLISRPY
jgi:hypothetical protein